VFHSWHLLFINPTQFIPQVTFFAYVILLLGGVARNIGIPVGALLFTAIFAGTRSLTFWPLSLLSAADRAAVRLIVVGLILIGLMAFRPQGLFGKREELLLDR
jgi:ABC-type branched-subunit amino acid transport system permease subunit